MSRSREQMDRALERANEIRLARAELKRRILSGEIFPASVLLDPPPEARSWSVGGLLRAQRRWGDARTRKFLARNCVPERKPLASLTERQRRALAAELAGAEGVTP